MFCNLYAPDEIPAVMLDDPRDGFTLDPAFLAAYRGRQPLWGPLGEDGKTASPIGLVTFLRTYAATLPDGSLETPAQVFARCVETVMATHRRQVLSVDGHWSDEKAQREGQEMFRRMWALKLLPGGRSLANLGRESLRVKGATQLNNCSFWSTRDLAADPVAAFAAAMDYLMLGSGVGFDVDGALIDPPTVTAPTTDDTVHRIADTREGWINALARVVAAFFGRATLPREWDFTAIRPKGAPLRTFGGTSSGPGPLRELLASVTAILAARVGQPVDIPTIVDVMNCIGRCVVAGGVRRSSEIALGPAGDKVFAGLKDPSAERELIASQLCREEELSGVAEADGKIRRLRDQQAGLSVLSAEWAALQDEVDANLRARSSACYDDPVWAELDRRINATPNRMWRWASNNSVRAAVGSDYAGIAARIARNGEPGLMWPENVRRFGRMVDGDLTQPRTANASFIPGLRPDDAIGCNPCGEIPLESGELCNLVETFPTRHKTVADWVTTLKYAYMVGKAVSCLPLHHPVTAEVVTRNRRLGISVTGIAGWYTKLGRGAMCAALDRGYRELRRLDRLYSGWLGIPESIRLTTVKPSGTLSLLAGVEGGMRFPEAPHLARIIRFHDTSPLLDRLAAAGYRIEPDRYAPNTVCVYFPHADYAVGRPVTDVSVWEQAQLQADLQNWWADNGVSATWSFTDAEAPHLHRVLTTYDTALKGATAYPHRPGAYVQPPYQPITPAEHAALSARLRPLDLAGIAGVHDTDEKFCDGGVCAIA